MAEICTFAELVAGNSSRQALDLRSKAARVLVEHAAIVTEMETDIERLNA
jgi:hypothetical protein